VGYDLSPALRAYGIPYDECWLAQGKALRGVEPE
jgi:hypothetical protein